MSKPKSKVITVQVVGPLEPYAGQLMGVLAVRGYAPLTRVPHLQVMTHLSKWMAARQLAVAELTAAQVDEYLGQRRRAAMSRFAPGPVWHRCWRYSPQPAHRLTSQIRRSRRSTRCWMVTRGSCSKNAGWRPRRFRPTCFGLGDSFRDTVTARTCRRWIPRR